MDDFSPQIENLDAFAFEPGEWQAWQAEEWNQQLLLYCFVRDYRRQPAEPLRATPEDLRLLVRDPRADPLVMVESLVMQLRWQATRHDRDPLGQLAHACALQRRRPQQQPSFFAFLWVTCLIAHGYPDASGDGLFHERFARVFPRCDSANLPCIHQGWELLSAWLEGQPSFEGFPYQPLELPLLDYWRPHISHSWNLAFPSLLDRRRLQRALESLSRRMAPLQPTNPALVQALLNRPDFSAPFRAQLQALYDNLIRAQPPSAWFVEQLAAEIQQLQPQPRRPMEQQQPAPGGYGPLLLASMGYGLGVLLLPPERQPPPAGLTITDSSPWLPGQPLLVPLEPADPDFAVFDAGSLALDPQEDLLPGLQPLLARGLLPFAHDPQFNLPRLACDSSVGPVTHVLVRRDRIEAFLGLVSAEPISADEEHWQCFGEIDADDIDLWHFPERLTSPAHETRPRLSTCAGVRLPAGQGYLASGLGLPQVRVHGPQPALKVLLLTATGDLAEYRPSPVDASAAMPQLWQPVREERQRTDLSPGLGRLVAFFTHSPTVERNLPLSALPVHVAFLRQEPIAQREDWGMALGPLMLPPPAAPASLEPPRAEAVQWARQRLNRGDTSVNPLFEEQILDSLAALFQRRASISRLDFFRLWEDLSGAPQSWPGFNDAVLRGWCEGGWIEQGVERRRGHWRIQPVDPRLVRLDGGRAQLVGLLSSRGLVNLLAQAHQLGLEVHSVQPSCALMPRGWRLTGRVDELAQATGLPIVEQQEWVPDPADHPWFIDCALESDGLPWPSGLGFRMATDRICGRRGQHNHVNKRLAAGLRAPESLRIDSERSRYGRRRWHSRDYVTGAVFTSCHRNRAALHALVVATDGLWPFGITDAETGQVDRLYDADAYLPLPIGRHAALTGRRMPGPTRIQRHEHTYRYHIDATLIHAQSDRKLLPLTPYIHSLH